MIVGGGNPGSQDRTGPRMAVVSHGLTLTRSGRVKVLLRCPLSEPLGCHGSVTLVTAKAPKRLQLGRARFRIPGGQTRMVTVRVTKRGRSLLRAKRRLTVSVVVIGIDRSGNQKRTTARRTLRNH